MDKESNSLRYFIKKQEFKNKFGIYETIRTFDLRTNSYIKKGYIQMKPTESEMEILQVLWKKGQSSVREVYESLDKKDVGYTTILKLMQIMLDKNMVTRDASSKSHLYSANINKEITQNLFLDKMIETVYNGNTSRLIMQALGNHKASKEEIDQIKQYLNNL